MYFIMNLLMRFISKEVFGVGVTSLASLEAIVFSLRNGSSIVFFKTYVLGNPTWTEAMSTRSLKTFSSKASGL